jgi:hypothetical protein
VQLDLRSLRTILWSGSKRRLKRLLLNQQAFALEQKLKVDDGLHPGPLVPDCLETLIMLRHWWPRRLSIISRMNLTASFVQRKTLSGFARMRSSGSIAKSNMRRQLCVAAHVP